MVTVTCVVALGIDTDLVALCCTFSTFIDICVERHGINIEDVGV